MAGFRCLGDRFYRAIIRAGIIFGDPDDQARNRKTDERAVEQRPAGETADLFGKPLFCEIGTIGCSNDFRYRAAADDGIHAAKGNIDHDPDQRDREQCGDEEAFVHRPHHIRAALAELNEIGSDDAGHDAGTADQQRQGHHGHQQIAQSLEQQCGENHGRTDGDDIGFEQVGRHPGAVTDIVAHIVGDHGRVARIVFRNAGFDLADQIGANVGSLGEDTAAQTRKDGNERGAECQTDQTIDHLPAVGCVATGAHEVPEEHRDREKGEARHQHAGDGTGAKRDGETLLQSALRSGSRADVRAYRDIHPDEACNARKDRADHETGCRDNAEEDEDEHRHDHTDNGNGGILALEIGLRTFLNGRGDFLHLFVAGAGTEHLAAGDEAVHDGKQSQHNRYENKVH